MVAVEGEEEAEDAESATASFDYLLSMPIHSLTLEKAGHRHKHSSSYTQSMCLDTCSIAHTVSRSIGMQLSADCLCVSSAFTHGLARKAIHCCIYVGRCKL